MTTPQPIRFAAPDPETLAGLTGRLAVIVSPDGKMDAMTRRINRATRGALDRLAASEGWAKAKIGDVFSLAMPAGLAADALDVLCLPRRPDVDTARRAGVNLAQAQGRATLTLLAGNLGRVDQIALGLALRNYDFCDHKTAPAGPAPEVLVLCDDPDAASTAAAPLLAIAEGVFMTRDLVNAPANVLGTTEFARRLLEMADLGLSVEVLDEEALQALGMGSLLSVGQGSASPSKVVVMQWQGGAEGSAPLALVGKGVVFDTGGISMKPAAGMEEMTMDMAGAGVVAGVMRALARRRAPVNVVGLVGLVENMVSGTATRPGDVVTSMKGYTIEVINTDAEGRLVLADLMWYAQQRFRPRGMIDLATLTGAVIIGLGHENAGVFSNDDRLCAALLKAAAAEGEGAWRMPLAPAYDDLLKSRIADMKNVGGRAAGAITAAQFLQRFVTEGMPWIHLDIAGVASVATDTRYAPKGASGWGVMTLSRLIDDMNAG